MQELKSEFIKLAKSQPASEWRSLKDGSQFDKSSTCTIVWVARKLGENRHELGERFGFTPFEAAHMYVLNDESSSAKEAHKKIIEYVNTL